MKTVLRSCIAAVMILAMSGASIADQSGGRSSGYGSERFVGPRTEPSKSFRDSVGAGTAPGVYKPPVNGAPTPDAGDPSTNDGTSPGGGGSPPGGAGGAGPGASNPQDCASRSLIWTVGHNNCQATVPATAHGQASTAVDSTAPETGSARFACSDGYFNEQPGATCEVSVGCAPQELTWRVGGATCAARSQATTSSGGKVTLSDSTVPGVGQATFTCQNNRLVEDPGSTCSDGAVQSQSCAPQDVSWRVNGVTCQARSSSAVAHGASSSTLVDSTQPTTGSATFRCADGALFENPGATCQQQTGCAATVVQWQVNGQTCEAQAGANPIGGNTGVLTDSVGPATGRASFLCTSTGYYIDPGATCSAQATGCSAQALTWSVGSAGCAAQAPNSPVNTQFNAKAQGQSSGEAVFTCQSNGAWSSAAQGATCSSAPSPNEPSQRCIDFSNRYQSGYKVKLTRASGNYTKVHLNGSSDVLVLKGDRPEVYMVSNAGYPSDDYAIGGYGNLLQQNGSSSYLTVVVVPSLEEFSLNGSGNAVVMGMNEANAQLTLAGTGNVSYCSNAQNLTIRHNGSGVMELGGVRAGNVSLASNGSGALRWTGTAEQLVAEHNGTGDMVGFSVGSVQIRSNGTANMSVTARRSVQAVINGTGNLYIYGNPPARSVSGSGTGRAYFP